MEFVNHGLSGEYEKSVAALSDERTLFSDCVICISDVLNAHFSLIDYFIENGEGEKGVGDIGLRDKGLLSSAVAMQIVGYSEN
jgi:hypothetical protein